jgi:hypothetical protein
MPARTLVRSAEQVLQARKAREEKVSLVIGRAVQSIIRSQRVVVAARIRLAALRRAGKRAWLRGR